jgi:hypothetical protein
VSTTIPGRVAAGMAFLDEHDAPWWREIDLETLDLGSGGRCVLGQRCPAEVYSASDQGDTAYAAMAKKWSGSIFDEDADRWAVARGFQAGEYDDGTLFSDQYDQLTAEWARLIRARRSA